MRQLSRVVWSEGMHLAPHHFQAQARYFDDAVQFATSALWFAAYGLSGYELDKEALQNGTVSVVHARGIFPDGLVFQMPESDPPPPPRRIAELFSPVSDRLNLYLGVPEYRPAAVNCALPDQQDPGGARFSAAREVIYDEITGADEKPVFLGRKNIQLLLEQELGPGLATLPVASVLRDGAGHFVYDPDFVPPCLKITASERLMQLLGRLAEILAEKSAALAQTPAERGELASAFSQREVAGFWFLHAVNSALAALRNLLHAKRGHPEEVFLDLSRLAGALCTFGLDSHPAQLPLYDHDRLGDCFRAIDEQIRFLLETIIPTNCVTIPLDKVQNYFYQGKVADQRCLGRSQWILSVRADIGEADLIEKVPQLVKVCSQEFVGKLVQRALPGMTLTHLPVPPSAVSPRVEYQYFSATKAGPCWEHLVQTRNVGVYVPGEIPSPDIALQVILGA